jgi:aromatic ring-opening dioxygenase catalytic subunit (LigB family)
VDQDAEALRDKNTLVQRVANFLRDFGPALPSLTEYQLEGILVFSAHWGMQGEQSGAPFSLSGDI